MAFADRLKVTHLVSTLLATCAGVLVAFAAWKLSALSLRYVAAVYAGLFLLSFCMVWMARIDTFLIYALIFHIPFDRFGKWLFMEPVVGAAQGVNLGASELLLFVAYSAWFGRIITARLEPFPRLTVFDALILVLLFAQAVSFLNAPMKNVAAFDLIYNCKYALIYFFLAHRLRREHLRWVVILILFGIVVESPIAFYERFTGHVGVGRTKGNVEADEFGQQYEVPGLEQVRPEGTTKDSHTLALYYVLLLPVPFVLMTLRSLRARVRCALAGLLVMGLMGLVFTFSRSGWLSFAIALAVPMAVIGFTWSQPRTVLLLLAFLFGTTLLYPRVYTYVFDRFVNAPHELLTSRYELNWTAYDIWVKHLWFGYGAGNYIAALEDPDIAVVEQDLSIYGGVKVPVHNALLYVAAETGVVGVIGFFGLVLVAMFRCYKHVWSSDLLIRGLALAILTGLFGYLLDGLTNPTFKEAVPYTLLWCYFGLVAAFQAIPPPGENLADIRGEAPASVPGS
jgi:O-antigen ligase